MYRIGLSLFENFGPLTTIWIPQARCRTACRNCNSGRPLYPADTEAFPGVGAATGGTFDYDNAGTGAFARNQRQEWTAWEPPQHLTLGRWSAIRYGVNPVESLKGIMYSRLEARKESLGV